ncbi:MAG TPA: hypothetical protein VFE51_14360 [Verrucomicrobiae bacterium]|nr:hypothetical protein [Verrucomicrobiae bacterium]
MKRVLYSTFICAAIGLQGCIQHSSVEQRVVELPAGNPNTSLATAAQIGNALVASGLGAAIQKQFPTLTQQQLQGLYLTWNSGNFQGKQSVFFLTGIRYTGTLPEAKAVADYCESQVKKAVITKFITPTGVHKMDFPNGDSALVLEYETSVPISSTAALRKEVDWIWEAFRLDVENAKLTNGVIRATHPEGTGLVTQSKGYGFVFTKRDDGKWHCLEDEKPNQRLQATPR